jgi:hypothetical protein
MSHDQNRPKSPNPVENLVCYYPKEGKEKEFLALLAKHWPALDALGLVTKTPAKIWKAYDIRANKHFFVEMFTWKDGSGSDVAHQSPEVMAIWEPMTPILENMQISEIEPLSLSAKT